ncbi:hypothetical protein ABZP36_001338 [Zizania latifolia]
MKLARYFFGPHLVILLLSENMVSIRIEWCKRTLPCLILICSKVKTEQAMIPSQETRPCIVFTSEDFSWGFSSTFEFQFVSALHLFQSDLALVLFTFQFTIVRTYAGFESELSVTSTQG